MQADASLAEMNADTWDRAFRVNTRGTMLMIKHAVPQMISAGGGSIINTSTGVALTGDIFNPAYSSSKAAVNARSEEHTSELQSLMRISYAVLCLKKKNKYTTSKSTYTK